MKAASHVPWRQSQQRWPALGHACVSSVVLRSPADRVCESLHVHSSVFPPCWCQLVSVPACLPGLLPSWLCWAPSCCLAPLPGNRVKILLLPSPGVRILGLSKSCCAFPARSPPCPLEGEGFSAGKPHPKARVLTAALMSQGQSLDFSGSELALTSHQTS